MGPDRGRARARAAQCERSHLRLSGDLYSQQFFLDNDEGPLTLSGRGLPDRLEFTPQTNSDFVF